MKRLIIALLPFLFFLPSLRAEFRAGAAVEDITPEQFPVYVNGGFLSRQSSKVNQPIHARSLAMDDGDTQICITIVDSCMVPRLLLDEAKQLASKTTQIPVDRMLIAATHTHSAPSCFGALGTPADPAYSKFMVPRIAKSIERAVANLEPARVGAAVIDAGEYTAVRRWVRRPDKMLTDPFGERTVRANMHPGPCSPDATGPSGPEDPDLSVFACVSTSGRPIALMANFANHYVGATAIHPDYFGLFADRIEERLTPKEPDGDHPAVVGIMSQGTSGDVWLFDYFSSGPRQRPGIVEYTNDMVDRALKAYETISFRDDVTLAMAQTDMPLRYRVPDEQRLAWAREVINGMGDRLPKDKTEVYAREAIHLHEKQETKVILQAVRIGDFGLTAMPNEVYALTGLKLKAMSPLQPTINIELANGAEGYIPPPEQFPLGGYNTWPARSAGLEEQAEPLITEGVVKLLEQVAGKPRRVVVEHAGPAVEAIQKLKPDAYWRMNEWAALPAKDACGEHPATYEQGVVYFLEGPEIFNGDAGINRCPHFAGGRMRVDELDLGSTYTVSLWFWNGMVTDARQVTGYLFSRGPDRDPAAPGDHLGLGGTYRPEFQGRLFFYNGNENRTEVVGKTVIERWEWHHAAMVRDEDFVKIYLDGKLELEGKAQATLFANRSTFFIGGRCDGFANFEGRLDEVAVFSRALNKAEIRTLSGSNP